MAFGDTLPRMSFGGIEFPYRRYSLRGSQRLVTHEYLRRPGGEVEKLKRRLYEISVECPFHEVFRTYPGLWPTKLAALSVATPSAWVNAVPKVVATCVKVTVFPDTPVSPTVSVAVTLAVPP